MKKIFLIFILISAFSCSKPFYYINPNRFSDVPQPPEVDYSKIENWASHPNIQDEADKIPKNSNFKDGQKEAEVDVFFVYPTVFIKEPRFEYSWNAYLGDSLLNKEIDEGTIRNQASVFNGSAKIYAPRYRQAHYYIYYTPNKEDKTAALDLAYSDVKKAFEYYLKNFNHGRPIIIAGHSQGTQHTTRLLQEYFDGKELSNQLVAAYIIGIATQKSFFKELKPCANPDQTGCFVSYTTFHRKYYPDWHPRKETDLVSVNPVSWTLNEKHASRFENPGGVGLNFNYIEHATDAQNHQGLLWIHQPHIFGRIFIHKKNWHIGDYNLFWGSIRKNVENRIEKFNQKK
ncbi:MAG: hypothetical protein RIR51_74 [Bacteroidota bacterium]|jgi:hypothetical protein